MFANARKGGEDSNSPNAMMESDDRSNKRRISLHGNNKKDGSCLGSWIVALRAPTTAKVFVASYDMNFHLVEISLCEATVARDLET